jgi:hypothetical protein
MTIQAQTKKAIWDDFCSRYNIASNGVPLYETENNIVITFPYGINGRQMLKRSSEMDALIVNEVSKVIGDYASGKNEYEGLVYMMYWKDGSDVIPLYIGKSEKLGKSKNLSENIKDIARNNGKFCRWGCNYAYHIGDLSAVVCTGHEESAKRIKYRKWAERLFVDFPTETPTLKRQVWFWLTAWRNGDVGIWKEYGATSLTFLEYLLIGIASDLFRDYLLNEEGVNRQ